MVAQKIILEKTEKEETKGQNKDTGEVVDLKLVTIIIMIKKII